MGLPNDIAADVADISRVDAVPAILNLACELTGMGFAAVARVTETHWVACSVMDKIGFGLQPGGELVVTTTICDEIRRSGQLVTIDHVQQDPTFCQHPTPAMYGLQSYISVPLRLRDGTFFGTLCAIDPQPHRVSSPHIIKSFELWAELIAFHLEAERRLASSATALRAERLEAGLREQFIAVLGHDLRSPLAAISSGAELLKDEALSGEGRNILQLLADSASRSMGIVDSVLDFARARLGGGIRLELKPATPLRPVLMQVIAEQRAAHPARQIALDLPELPPLPVDPGRLAQLLANLLSNALTHGASDAPVAVTARVSASEFELAVSNGGPPIPESSLAQLFQPFFRANPQTRGEGLGLGLFIAHAIAEAHGATLTASSVPGSTRFSFRLPRGAVEA